MGLDMGALDPDQPLREVKVSGRAEGLLDSYTRMDPTIATGRRVRSARPHAGSPGKPAIVGSPTTVADQLERYVDEVGIDGYNLVRRDAPGVTFPSFVDLVVPELQRRGRVQDRVRAGARCGRSSSVARPRLPETHRAARYRNLAAETVSR